MASNSGSSLRGWMQSTGHTSTHDVSLVSMHGSVMMNGISVELSMQGGLTEEEKRTNVIRLAFGGSEERFQEFVRVIREDIPDGTGVVLRGSAVTGTRWKDGAPFDAEGPGTSDLDLTLVGDAVIGLFTVTGFFRMTEVRGAEYSAITRSRRETEPRSRPSGSRT